ncbi:hypothetical protein [Curtobacterium sp. MCBD17_021]|uniref:hypothetical protein n=1 Tax=Curtobacterium sp. MCBD17_021 TaxID=2175665 RepID=UPI001C650F31|nr:hypothetical protein [Curtobacterium sp. MCBD17_021]
MTIVGLVVTAVTVAQPVSVGWFATAPLSGTTFRPVGAHLVSTGVFVGAGVLVVGLLVLATLVGYRLGVRRAASDVLR